MATDKSWKESWQFGRADDDGPPLSSKQFLLRFSEDDAQWLESTFPPDPGTGIAAGEAYTMQRGPAAGHPVIANQDIPPRRSQATAWIRSVVSAAIAQAKADGFEVPAPINEGREREQLLEKAHSEGLKASELAKLLLRPQSAINYAKDNDQLATFGIKGDRGESIACVGWREANGRYFPIPSDRAPRTPPELPKPSEERQLIDQAYSQGLTGAELAKLLGRSRGSITHARNRGQLLTLGKRPANGYKSRQLVGWREANGRYYPTFSLP